ncbi:MAG: Gfo/Idh/MocA family oxidoreductase [Flavobacteriaceae bacterium]|nr:Gfo/Idh/MocA family oxidoreductase [Flavobacteriaceae bacterium]
MEGRKIKWGIIGLGNIAHKFAEDLLLLNDVELHSIASTSINRANKFKKKHNVKKVFSSYSELLEDEELEVVYIATINTLHLKWTLKALNNRKAVLCEKPLAINSKEVRKMIEASRKNKTFLMEALWSRFNPTIIELKKKILKGLIGELKFMYSEFSFFFSMQDPSHRLLDPKKGSGSLLDIGIYPIFLAYIFMGIPDEILAQANYHKTGADIQMSMIFKYEKSQAILYSGLTNNSDNKSKICGTLGEVHLNSRWHETDGYTLIRGSKEKNIINPKTGRGYIYEIQEVNKCIKKNKVESLKWSHKNSLELSILLDKVKESSNIKKH